MDYLEAQQILKQQAESEQEEIAKVYAFFERMGLTRENTGNFAA